MQAPIARSEIIDMSTQKMQNQKEHHLNSIRLAGWDLKTSRAHIFLSNFLGANYATSDALCLAQLASHYIGLEIDRAAQRRKNVLVKWFDENIDLIETFCKKYVTPIFEGDQTEDQQQNILT
ncbi:hypothetical protein TVAG_247160 [Trichomonas vaginalis G3]|uniref:Uncharacterized protein n=1 Tax=Trichomonas vaginalis (strain ATCC PRA-98 / G3) TaxID=412133 RepID=A2DKQ4_TRIV3|nr:hypothetical protein TVAGG3_0560750 [Trichomonas vaginalis G3]EAY19037.1 hypothetical protein TVAG_247160 [Trichomonas vaginalis G3]KAI5521169.1 hypothetical protein TVAGG3_0560750 [Trichomonas vaginalis G3]|eukprot:XP_001580023.1 hypothetical protein [Trichomonas vaginalis G3]